MANIKSAFAYLMELPRDKQETILEWERRCSYWGFPKVIGDDWKIKLRRKKYNEMPVMQTRENGNEGGDSE